MECFSHVYGGSSPEIIPFMVFSGRHKTSSSQAYGREPIPHVRILNHFASPFPVDR
jgi:hypothetical protein